VVVCLVWYSDDHAYVSVSFISSEADRFNGIRTFFILDVSALLYMCSCTYRVGSRGACTSVPSYLNLSEFWNIVADGIQVSAGVCRYSYRAWYILKVTVLPDDIPAVLIAIPDLLSLAVDDPLGVTLLFGDVLTDCGLVVLYQGLLSTLVTFLGNKLMGVDNIIMVDASEGSIGAVGISNNLTFSYWNRDAGRVLVSGAGSGGSECTDLMVGGVVEDLTVGGDVHTVLVVTVSMVIPPWEPRNQG